MTKYKILTSEKLELFTTDLIQASNPKPIQKPHLLSDEGTGSAKILSNFPVLGLTTTTL